MPLRRFRSARASIWRAVSVHARAVRRPALRTVTALAITLALPVLAAAQPGFRAGTQIAPGEACPPGMTEIRPRTCQAPELPPPSIVDYRPRNTLQVPTHLVPRAKFPVVDFHGHPGANLASVENLERMGRELDELNVRLMIAADNVSGERLVRTMEVINASATMKDRVRVLTGIDLRNVGPGWAERAVKQLEADVAAGAVGVGEISKAFGLSIRKADGTRLRLDDPDLDPVWEACARLNLPVFIHTGDPQEFWQPIDYQNERWLELALFPGRRYPPEEYPSFEQLVEERNNLFRRHKNTTFVTAHLGWHAHELDKLGALFDELPNLHAELGAVLYDIGRQPRAARKFFLKYQDRLLFGKDSYQPIEYPYYWRVFETDDDYFEYYRDYHAFWKLYGLDLPDDVLRKVYFANALRLMPRVPRGGFPN